MLRAKLSYPFQDSKEDDELQADKPLNKISPLHYAGTFYILVGMAGFEPTTSSTPCWRDTGLRYIPQLAYKYIICPKKTNTDLHIYTIPITYIPGV